MGVLCQRESWTQYSRPSLRLTDSHREVRQPVSKSSLMTPCITPCRLQLPPLPNTISVQTLLRSYLVNMDFVHSFSSFPALFDLICLQTLPLPVYFTLIPVVVGVGITSCNQIRFR